mmetsp:Transcript_43375/g.134058  ORF Transcript_43375/g.134058 Transcript_43375/m.134058 type:complete len:204 (-) Transcript_43375:1033-1644(-)
MMGARVRCEESQITAQGSQNSWTTLMMGMLQRCFKGRAGEIHGEETHRERCHHESLPAHHGVGPEPMLEQVLAIEAGLVQDEPVHAQLEDPLFEQDDAQEADGLLPHREPEVESRPEALHVLDPEEDGVVAHEEAARHSCRGHRHDGELHRAILGLDHAREGRRLAHRQRGVQEAKERVPLEQLGAAQREAVQAQGLRNGVGE